MRCQQCARGYYSSDVQAEKCLPCKPGNACVDVWYLQQLPSVMGWHGNIFARNGASHCCAGLYQLSAGGASCLKCEDRENMYQDKYGQADCELCPENTERRTFSLEGARLEPVNRTVCQCKTNYYSPDGLPGKASRLCSPSMRRRICLQQSVL